MSAQYPAYLEWPELRRMILAGGGIAPSTDWPSDWYPADLLRRRGKAPDLVAAETVLGRADVPPWGDGGDDAAMFSYLQRAYAEWQRWRQDRPRREARYVDVYELAREHGLSLRSVWNVARAARLSGRRGTVPRRTYFGAERSRKRSKRHHGRHGASVSRSPRGWRHERARQPQATFCAP